MILEANLAIFFFILVNIVCPFLELQIWCILLTISAICSAISMNLLEIDKDYIKVIFISTSMGLVFSKSLSYTISNYSCQNYIHMQFFLYVCIIAFFHYSEYVSVSVFNPSDLTIDAFLLTHSWEYGLALCMSVAEMGLESYLFPFLKGNLYLISFGLLMTSLGEFIRKLAMYTAGISFTHMVSTWKEDEHRLVTSGIYSLCRHPGYVGWTIWSIGTQVVLCNPFCFVAYICAIKVFYKERIRIEEFHLIRFFGKRYIEYQQRVPTGLPFIKGLVFNLQNN